MTSTEELRKKIVFALQDDETLDLTVGTNVKSITLKITEIAIEHFHTIHSKALACHCECLGMNAENSIAVCNNYTPPYRDADYFSTTQKWGLTNEKGEPII